MRKWFQYTNYNSLTISKSEFTHKKPVTTVIKISDIKYIQRLTKDISELPTDAKEIMISFEQNAEYLNLSFCNDKQEYDDIKFFEGRIKTPNTGFYVDNIPKAVSLEQEIKNLFTPKFNAPIPVITGHEFPFPDFKVIYIGKKQSAPAPVTVSTITHIFKIIPKTGATIELNISSGQLSPQPTDFTIGQNHYTLLSYELSSGIRLYPDYFAIVKK